MTIETWLLFCSASLLVILIPGPLSLLMISNSLNYGIIKSAPAFIGGTSASLILLTASATGLGALLLASENLFTLIRYIGALYLIYLGYQAWRAARSHVAADLGAQQAAVGFKAMFWRAFSLGISNPKDILFFVAFLPQFIDPQQSMTTQLLIVAASWCVIDLACKLFYGNCARLMAPVLKQAKNMQLFNRLCAGLFASAGAAALLR
ncbi:LysE family translocator [Motiliproteus coralliicola]|uniref:LysE family translocator n=1 Tax=Motiliproteus coralliicola TaxID=2283196 RepID=A0A369WMX6_9GAMM|nr:LysE family transporter [Motiliproteus coralliicola]RDE23072.1 LysE family translocator [Motiliproteus coralliicola]